MGEQGRGRDILQSRFAGEGRLSGGLFKETIETCVTTAATGRVICALAAHFLFSTGILYGECVSMSGYCGRGTRIRRRLRKG